MLTVQAVDHLVFNVRDVDVSAEWYARALLECTVMTRRPHPVTFVRA
jgi:hypothetical protein